MIFESFLLNSLVSVILIIALTFDYVTKFFSYWYVRHVPYKKPIPLFGSDYHRVFGLKSNTNEVNELYSMHKKEKFVGRIKSRMPDLIIKDPPAIQTVLSKDCEYFANRGLALDKSRDVCLKNNLFYAEGAKSTFLRGQFESILKSLTWDSKISADCLTGINGETNVQVLLSNMLDEVFFNLLINEKEYKKESIIKEMRSSLQKITVLDKVKNYLKDIFPSLYTIMGFSTFNESCLSRHLNSLNDSKLLEEIRQLPIKSVFEVKSKYFKSRNCDPDMNLLLDTLSTFIAEGYTTCHYTLTALLFELAKHPNIQKNARSSLQSNYFNNVIMETLRLHPPHSLLTRKCIKMHKLPEDYVPKFVTDKGLTVTVPVEALHKDPEYYEEPEKFIPDRFWNKDYTSSFVYLPFGAGPRKCVGEELSLQIIRNVARTILQNYEIESTERTPEKLHSIDHAFKRVIVDNVCLRLTPIKS